MLFYFTGPEAMIYHVGVKGDAGPTLSMLSPDRMVVAALYAHLHNVLARSELAAARQHCLDACQIRRPVGCQHRARAIHAWRDQPKLGLQRRKLWQQITSACGVNLDVRSVLLQDALPADSRGSAATRVCCTGKTMHQVRSDCHTMSMQVQLGTCCCDISTKLSPKNAKRTVDASPKRGSDAGDSSTIEGDG